MAFTSDYGTVSSALNSGVPLTMSNHSELAAQFASFTKQIVHPRKSDQDGQKGRSPFLGIF